VKVYNDEFGRLIFPYCHLFCSDGDQKLRLRIEDPPRRKHMVYLGGAVLAGIMKVWVSC